MDIKSLKDISYKDSSFGLVRTNPLITGNIKFTVDSDNGLWLNTIDANDILAQNMFKKYAINLTRSYPANVKTFFNQKNVSTDIIYDVYKGVDPSKVSHDYKDQYDFSFYFAGAKYLNSVQYSEKFSYFAPIYVNNCDIPEYFVIFKIPGALNDNIKTLDANKESLYDNTNYLYDMMKDAMIVKTYDMTVGSTLGDYMRNKIFKDSLFPTEPLNVNFNKDCQTTWYGLNIKSGVYCGTGEYLYDYYKSEHTLKDFEYYITCGYKRNGLLYPNILNMEFLFNDDTSELFEHDRYFGMYINSADIERVGIDMDLLKSRQSEYGNTPNINYVIDEFGKKDIIIKNDNGCVVEASMLNDNELLNSDNVNISKNSLRCPYIKDKYNNLHTLKLKDEINNFKKINFNEKTIHIKHFSGSDEVIDISGNGFIPLNNSRCSILLHLDTAPNNGDILKIYYMGGSRVDENGDRYDAIYINDGFIQSGGSSTKVYGNIGEYYTNIQNFDFIKDTNETKGSFAGNYDFSKELDDMKLYNKEYCIINKVSKGHISFLSGLKNLDESDLSTITSDDFSKYIGYAIQKRLDKFGEYHYYLIKDIDTITDNLTNYYSVGMYGIHFDMDGFMNTIVKCVKEFPLKNFSIFYNNKDLIFVVNSDDSHDNDIAIKYESTKTEYSYIGSYNESDGKIYSYGSTSMNNIVIIPNDFEKRIMDNYNGERDYLVRSKSGYSKIAKVIHYSGYLDGSQSQEDFESAYDIYKNYIGLVLEKDELPEISASKFEITKVYRPYIGVCSFYKVKDFDFNYHSTEYSKIPSEEYEHKFFVLPGNNLEKLVVYAVINGNIIYNNESYSDNYVSDSIYKPDLFVVTEDDTTYITSNDAFVVPVAKYLFETADEYEKYLKDNGIEGAKTFGYATASSINKTIYNCSIDGNSIRNNNLSDYPLYAYGILDESNEFLSFNGFPSILSSDNSEYDTTSASYIFRDRFLNKTGMCEYDYNKENYNPQYAYFSNTVGYSCKFSYMNGTDIRNNPYRLNVSSIFGKYNLSPSSDSSRIDVNSFSNEWFYIVNDLESDNFINKKVFDWDRTTGEITLDENFSVSDLSTFNKDYAGYIYKYSDVKYSESAKSCRTFFKGSLLKFDETDENGVVIDKSRKYDGYKFTSILQAFPEEYDEYGRQLKPPFEFVLITDDDKKLIVLGIILYLGTADSATYYTDSTKDSTKTSSSYGNIIDSYNGDYRFIKNSDGYISNITYSDFYMYKSKKYSVSTDAYSHINITNQAYFDSSIYKMSCTSEMYKTISGFKEYIDTFHFSPELSLDFNNGNVSFRSKTIENISERIGFFGEDYNSSAINKSSDTMVLFDSDVFAISQYVDYISIRNFKMFDIKQLFGGAFYYQRIFRYLTLTSIKKLISSGTFLQSNSNYISMSFLNDSIIDKEYKLINNTIYDDRVIGYENSEEKLVEPYSIHRMQGQYMPVFTDVFYFYNDSDNGVYNGEFASDIEGFGNIKDFGYLKITDEDSSVFGYENSTTYDLKYPYVGECTVDNIDMNIMHTSWDVDFHRKFITNETYENVYGTLRREEDDTYINNLINLPSTLDITKFDVSEVDDISLLNTSDYEIAYNSNFKDTGNVSGSISIEDLVIDKLIELGIEKSFELITTDATSQIKYTESNIDDYIRSYIKINILPLYEVKTIVSYYRINNNIDMFSISESDYKEHVNNVKLNRDVKINKTGDKFKIDFSYPINYDKNTELFFDIKLKLI